MKTVLDEGSPGTAAGGLRPHRDHPLRPTALEVASGSMWGEHQAVPALPISNGTPLLALENAVLPGLQRPPCLVSFSGGRDSSTVLAVATRVARRHGLEPPIPMTLRFSRVPQSDERAWQEQVIRHLALTEWEIRDLDDELELLGPLSTRFLRRHGVVCPPNRFFHVPHLEAARGGSLLTGVGGDNVFATWRWQSHVDLLARRRSPEPRDLRRLAFLAAPPLLRYPWERRRHRRYGVSWLRDEARRELAAIVARKYAWEPRRWSEWVARLPRARLLAAVRWSFERLGADADAVVIHPFLAPGFIAAVAQAGGGNGFGDRTAAMRQLFTGLLPQPVLSRPTKATFDEVFWGPRVRSFAESWSGEGVDAELVDPEVLREEWLSRSPHFGSAMLLQKAWLSRQAAEA